MTQINGRGVDRCDSKCFETNKTSGKKDVMHARPHNLAYTFTRVLTRHDVSVKKHNKIYFPNNLFKSQNNVIDTSCWLVCWCPSWIQIQMGRAESRCLSLVGWSRCLLWAVTAGWRSLAWLEERGQQQTVFRKKKDIRRVSTDVESLEEHQTEKLQKADQNNIHM